MICDKCHEEAFFLFGRDIDGKHYLLCWNCIVALKEKEDTIRFAVEKMLVDEGIWEKEKENGTV